MEAPLPPRQYFGRYETLFPIASGGMAEVYAARSSGEAGFQKLVALKRMRPEMAEDARFVSMFLDEGRMAANISSPNVVATLDLGRAEDNSLYLVMELVTGVSVASILKEAKIRGERIPVDVAVEIIAQAATGLHDAHEARAPTGEPLGIIHRDCSPHNILVDVGGQVKITDFGIAKAMERQTQSQAGEMKGKLSYLSPEQARGRPLDRRVDVFILGIVAWEFISQRRLFTGSSAVEALHKITSMPIPRLDEMRDDVPERVADAVAQALVRDRDERFATCAAFGNALSSSIPKRTTRTQIGAFMRANAGSALSEIERKIRMTFGTKSEPPPPSVPAYPIPLVAPKLDASLLSSEMGIAPAVTEPDQPLTPPPMEFSDPTDPEASAEEAVSIPIPDASGNMEIPAQTIPMDALQLAGLHLGLDPHNPIDLNKPDTIPETDLEAAELERLRHPDPLPEESGAVVAKLPGLRDDPTEPEFRSGVGNKRRGMSGSIAPPPGPDAQADPTAPPVTVDDLPTHRSTIWILIAIAVLVAGGGGAVAAWWLRTSANNDPEVPDVTAPEESAESTVETGSGEPVAPTQVAPPPVVQEPPHAEVQEALGMPEPEAVPEPAPRRRRRPVTPPPPSTVTGSQPPEGDRQAAFDEIPW